MTVVPAAQVLRLLIDHPSIRCIDVRSSGEFLTGAIPSFANMPILNDQQRHEVGLCFKNHGQDAAIKLGHQLVNGERDQLTSKWIEYLQDAEWPLVTCWRGGLRSKTASEWILERDQRAICVQGGYKSLRHELTQCLNDLPRFYVISGPTGSGKTKLLNDAKTLSLNLEYLAKHRGSAFGSWWQTEQPSQATFENSIAFELLKLGKGRCLFIEDESLTVGKVHLPLGLKDKMKASPVVKVQVDLKTRIDNILVDYVTEPLRQGISCDSLRSHYESCLIRIKNKLGGAKYEEILVSIRSAFEKSDLELHRQWIEQLLITYYDKTYSFSDAKLSRPIAFEGDWSSCLNWMQQQSV